MSPGTKPLLGWSTATAAVVSIGGAAAHYLPSNIQTISKIPRFTKSQYKVMETKVTAQVDDNVLVDRLITVCKKENGGYYQQTFVKNSVGNQWKKMIGSIGPGQNVSWSSIVPEVSFAEIAKVFEEGNCDGQQFPASETTPSSKPTALFVMKGLAELNVCENFPNVANGTCRLREPVPFLSTIKDFSEFAKKTRFMDITGSKHAPKTESGTSIKFRLWFPTDITINNCRAVPFNTSTGWNVCDLSESTK